MSDTGMLLLYIGIGLVLAVLVIVLIAVIRKNKKTSFAHGKLNISYRGCVELDTGRLVSEDNRFLNEGADYDTVVIGSPANCLPQATVNGNHCLTLKKCGDGKIYRQNFVDVVIIGRRQKRADAVYLLLDDASVSGEHCYIYLDNKGFFLADLGAANRSYLNAKAVTSPIAVKTGDKLKVGGSEYIIELY